MRLAVDGIAYGLTPYGGLITYWNAILPRLAALGVDVGLMLGHVRSPAPLPAATTGEIGADLFLSTYYTMPANDELATVVIVHDLIYEQFPELAAALGDSETPTRKQRCIAGASRIIVPSQTTADLLREHHKEIDTPISVIRHGVEDEFRQRPSDHASLLAGQLLEQHGVGRAFVLHVGGRAHYKNFRSLLGAFSRDTSLSRRFHLVCVGSEGELSAEEIRAAPEGVATLLGEVSIPVLVSLYHRASAVVSASTVEGFGLPLAEAAVAGTPIACSDIPAYREVVGDGAAYFDPHDLDSISNGIQIAVDSGRSGLPEDRRVDLSWDRAAKETHEALAQAVVDKTRR